MAQWVKVLAAKLEGMSLIHGSHKMEGENGDLRVF